MKSWQFEQGHSGAEFKVKHMMVTWVRGMIKNASGVLDFDPETKELQSISATLDPSSIWSDDKGRDGHLKKADFLDTENHKEITFKSTKIEKQRDNKYSIQGDLTIRGITKPVSLNAEYLGLKDTPFYVGSEDKGPVPRVGFQATTTFDRNDFDVKWNSSLDAGGVVVGNKVHVTLDVEGIIPPK